MTPPPRGAGGQETSSSWPNQNLFFPSHSIPSELTLGELYAKWGMGQGVVGYSKVPLLLTGTVALQCVRPT
jgi:hypothetical protein